MLYVQLDANWPDHPSIMEAGLEGAGLHAVTMCLAKRLNTDGWVSRRLLRRHGASDDLIDALVELELFDEEGDDVRPHDWLQRNPSKAAIAAKRAAKKRAAREGNHKRWGHDGEVDDCPTCTPESQVVAGSDPVGSHPVAPMYPVGSPYTESETEPEAAASDATDPLGAVRLTAEERQQRIMQAATLIAEERAIGRHDIGPGWVHGAARGIASDHHQALHAHLFANPDATVVDLMELMDASRKRPAKTGGVTVTDDAVFLPGTGWCKRTTKSAAGGGVSAAGRPAAHDMGAGA